MHGTEGKTCVIGKRIILIAKRISLTGVTIR
jgi:hypothetical protein